MENADFLDLMPVDYENQEDVVMGDVDLEWKDESHRRFWRCSQRHRWR